MADHAGEPARDMYLHPDLAGNALPRASCAAELLSWAEQVVAGASVQSIYREKEGRVTVRHDTGAGVVFIKLHRGVGWREIFKNLLQLRLPVLGAATEYRALRFLQRLGIAAPEPLAFAQAGMNPARRRSVVITAALDNTVTLENLCATWGECPPSPRLRHNLTRAVAAAARRMHRAGINHRDFYLCHLYVDQETLHTSRPQLFLLDFHRAQIRSRIPARWLAKDLAGLYFSAQQCGLEPRDGLRFMRHYHPGGLRTALAEQQKFWRGVERRAKSLYDRSPAGAGKNPASFVENQKLK